MDDQPRSRRVDEEELGSLSESRNAGHSRNSRSIRNGKRVIATSVVQEEGHQVHQVPSSHGGGGSPGTQSREQPSEVETSPPDLEQSNRLALRRGVSTGHLRLSSETASVTSGSSYYTRVAQLQQKVRFCQELAKTPRICLPQRCCIPPLPPEKFAGEQRVLGARYTV
eukprot:CAMPEP_0172085462 /NCGR_PEP_ID=MMETSP1043-20130122/21563_1 /TAXON_ID=464988 /ORGANISM="Hemiselmis andersenii, Strain CCMP441" /LENGTH=167 /DNA_ID=CAMNT_0012747401 /DNA_START=148 /DNA_END=649 /DNA_ORIENTATION=+